MRHGLAEARNPSTAVCVLMSCQEQRSVTCASLLSLEPLPFWLSQARLSLYRMPKRAAALAAAGSGVLGSAGSMGPLFGVVASTAAASGLRVSPVRRSAAMVGAAATRASAGMALGAAIPVTATTVAVGA